MKYKFYPEAFHEFRESVIYYSEKSLPLGLAFYFEVENAINKIVKNPTLFRIIEEDGTVVLQNASHMEFSIQ